MRSIVSHIPSALAIKAPMSTICHALLVFVMDFFLLPLGTVNAHMQSSPHALCASFSVLVLSFSLFHNLPEHRHLPLFCPLALLASMPPHSLPSVVLLRAVPQLSGCSLCIAMLVVRVLRIGGNFLWPFLHL